MTGLFDRLSEAVSSLGIPADQVPVAGMVVGAELDELTGGIETGSFIPWIDIPHAPHGYEGSGLTLGTLAGRPVALAHAIPADGQGWTPEDAAFPVRLLGMIGISDLIVCGSASGLSDGIEPGSVMLVTDHLNLTGDNSLIGPNDDRLGPRFPDMSAAYSSRLIRLARTSGIAERIPLHDGVYAAVIDPGSMSGTDRKRLGTLGADAVGAGVVHEVTAAVHMGREVLAISAITDSGPDEGSGTGSAQEYGANLAEARQLMTRLVKNLTAEL